MHFQAKNDNFGELAGRRRDAAPRGSGALRGDVAVVLGMSADFVKTWIYPAGWVADKTGGKEKVSIANVRLTEDLGAQGGTFTMGSIDGIPLDSHTYDYEKPLHDVTVDSFNILSTEVTQELFEAIMGYNESYFTGGSQGWKSHPKPELNVLGQSWRGTLWDVVECNWEADGVGITIIMAIHILKLLKLIRLDLKKECIVLIAEEIIMLCLCPGLVPEIVPFQQTHLMV